MGCGKSALHSAVMFFRAIIPYIKKVIQFVSMPGKV